MCKAISSFVLALVLSLGMSALAQAAPDPATEIIFEKLLTSTVSNDYDGFVAACDDTMKAALTKPKLEAVSKLVGPRLGPGYDAGYLGELKQNGFAVHLWRVRPKSGGDDYLATLSMKDGKAGGFYLH